MGKLCPSCTYLSVSLLAIKAKESLQVERLKAVADRGYAHGKELKACLEAGLVGSQSFPDEGFGEGLR